MQRDAWRCQECKERRRSSGEDHEATSRDHNDTTVGDDVVFTQDTAQATEQAAIQEEFQATAQSETQATEQRQTATVLITEQAAILEEIQATAHSEPQDTEEVQTATALVDGDVIATDPLVAPQRRYCKGCTFSINKYRSPTGIEFLTCTKCEGKFHKKKSCSGVTPGQLKSLDMTKWWCEGCLEIAEMQAAPRDDTTPDIEYIVRDGEKGSQCRGGLKIMHWNAGGLTQPKLAELRTLLIKVELDIVAVQETNMISKDTTPKIPGYTVKRKDRWQAKGNGNNRGGGLLMCIKKDTPFKEIKRNLREPEDDITESQTYEFPIACKGKGKLRVTNVYIPPIRNTESERRRQRRSDIQLEKWPAGRDDIIVGDMNALSTLWDKKLADKDKVRNDEATKRGELIEDWLAEKDMATVNERKISTLDSTAETASSPDLSIVHTFKLDKFSWKYLMS